MKLKSILKQLPAEHLQRIERHWDISPADLSGVEGEEERCAALVANLYQRLQSPAAWEHATEGLDAEQRDLVSFLAIHGGDLEESEVLARFFEGDAKRMGKVLESLAALGVVFVDDVPGLPQPLRLVGIPEPFLRYIDLPSFWEGYLGHFLKELSNNELKHIATVGLKLHPECANKNYLIHLIRSALLDPKSLRKLVDSLPDGPASAFQALLNMKGVGIYRDLLELNVQRRYDHSRGDSIQWLLATSGLVHTAVPGGNKYNNLLMVPRDIMWIIGNDYKRDARAFRELDSVTVVEKEERPSTIIDNSNTLLRDLVVLAVFVHTTPVRVLATGGIGKNDLKKVLPRLSRFKTAKYVEFLSLFLIERKFLVSTGETYRVSHTFLDWIADSRQAYQDMLSWYLSTTSWNEEFVEGNTVHVEPKPQGLSAPGPFRRVVISLLAEMPKDRWCVERGFLDEALPKIQQELPKRAEPLNYEKHTRSNELVVESILAECLCWLGLVAIGLKDARDAESLGMRQGDGKTLKARGGGRGRPRKQRPVRYDFRFTDLGRFAFTRPLKNWGGLFDATSPEEFMPLRFDVDAFIVQPTHEVIVPPDLELRTFYSLNQMCEVKSIDVMSLVEITRHSVRDALDHGLSGEEVEHFLERHSRTPLPESLRILVRDVARKHGEVNMGYAGGYIVIDDEPVLAQVRVNKKLAPSIKAVLDDKVVLLNPDVDLPRLARDLQKIGFMPRLESQTVQVRDEEKFSLTLGRDDMVRLIAAVRLAAQTKDEKGREVAHDRLGPLLERLKADARSFAALNDLAEPLVATWAKAQSDAVESRIASVQREYSRKIDHLVSAKVTRGASKFHFDGPNPATDLADVERLLDFAIENEFEVEIEYVKANQKHVVEVVAPESLERDRLYAHCRTRDAYSVYRLERIQQAKLV